MRRGRCSSPIVRRVPASCRCPTPISPVVLEVFSSPQIIKENHEHDLGMHMFLRYCTRQNSKGLVCGLSAWNWRIFRTLVPLFTNTPASLIWCHFKVCSYGFYFRPSRCKRDGAGALHSTSLSSPKVHVGGIVFHGYVPMCSGVRTSSCIQLHFERSTMLRFDSIEV